jgi:hypothetical protein
MVANPKVNAEMAILVMLTIRAGNRETLDLSHQLEQAAAFKAVTLCKTNC